MRRQGGLETVVAFAELRGRLRERSEVLFVRGLDLALASGLDGGVTGSGGRRVHGSLSPGARRSRAYASAVTTTVVVTNFVVNREQKKAADSLGRLRRPRQSRAATYTRRPERPLQLLHDQTFRTDKHVRNRLDVSAYLCGRVQESWNWQDDRLCERLEKTWRSRKPARGDPPPSKPTSNRDCELVICKVIANEEPPWVLFDHQRLGLIGVSVGQTGRSEQSKRDPPNPRWARHSGNSENVASTVRSAVATPAIH